MFSEPLTAVLKSENRWSQQENTGGILRKIIGIPRKIIGIPPIIPCTGSDGMYNMRTSLVFTICPDGFQSCTAVFTAIPRYNCDNRVGFHAKNRRLFTFRTPVGTLFRTAVRELKTIGFPQLYTSTTGTEEVIYI